MGKNFGSKMPGVPKVVTLITFDEKNFFLKNSSKPVDPPWGRNFTPPIEISMYVRYNVLFPPFCKTFGQKYLTDVFNPLSILFSVFL